MKAIKMKWLLCLLLICIWSQGLLGQHNVDSIMQRYSRFYTISNLKVSDNGQWISFSRIYKKNTDTTIVTATNKEQSVITALTGVSESHFLPQNRFLWLGGGNAQMMNLITGEKKDFKEASKIEVIPSLGYYAVLYKNHLLEVYDRTDKLVTAIPDVMQSVGNKKAALYLLTKSGETSSLWVLQPKTFKKIYSSEHPIKKMMLAPSQKYIAVTEQEKATGKLRLTLIDTGSGKSSTVGSGFMKADYIEIREIKNGEAYFLDYIDRPKSASVDQPEIWYSSDPYLWLHRMGEQYHEYWVYDTGSQQSQKISQDLPFLVSMDNVRYFLGFDRKERNQYVSSVSWFNIFLYDRLSKTSTSILPQVSSLTVSNGGRFILGLDEEKKRWMLYDILLSETRQIENTQIYRPTFSDDNRYVFFESDDGLYRFDLTNKKLNSVIIGKGKKITITNALQEQIYGILGADFTVRTIDTEKQIILEQYDKKSNETSYKAWSQNKEKVLIPSTKNKVSDFKMSKQNNTVFSLEENFNVPQTIYQYRNLVKKKVYQSNTHDREIQTAKQEVFSYKNSKGISIKGVLYYPLHFDAGKKYPLVVSIYEVQNKSASLYPYPYFSGIGINIRTLIDNGYFVFLPDVILDDRGPGYSVLDCVHSGLDALKANPYIDMDKVGLMGHSFGGFGTNFVATRSNRFTAYLSGASVTDLVKFYFSFSQERRLPNYPRFENGQFDMKKPFSENKMLYYDNSPITNVDKVHAPMLLWTGLKDGNVPYDHTVEFYTGLLRNRKKGVAVYYKDQDHDLSKNSAESVDLHLRILDWWNYFLKGKKDIPWIEKEMKMNVD